MWEHSVTVEMHVWQTVLWRVFTPLGKLNLIQASPKYVPNGPIVSGDVLLGKF